MKKGFTLLELIIIISVICIFVFMAIPKLSDVKESKRAAKMQKDLVDMRIALEKYYEETGEYPRLVGYENTLDEVVARGSDTSFRKVFGKKAIPATPQIEGLEQSNKVYDVSDFENANTLGGWNYEQSGKTGEIHINLPKDIFKQGIDWSKQ